MKPLACCVLPLVLAAAPSLAAQPAKPPLDADGKPHMEMAEAMQSFEALGYRIAGGQSLNLCGKPGLVHVTYRDLNGDGFPEAVGTADDPCYGGPFVTIAQRQTSGVWSWLFRTRGTMTVGPGKTGGWQDLHIKTRCDTPFVWDGQRYSQSGYCAADHPDPNAAPLPDPVPADFDTAFAAAGFRKTKTGWQGCDPEFPSDASVQNGDYRDINGDGVNELIITDSGMGCYGMTGTGFAIMTKDAAGRWNRFYASEGIPEFVATTVKTPGGWPDMEVGGPGFCFPIYRWNGKDYAFLKNHEYDKSACAGQ